MIVDLLVLCDLKEEKLINYEIKIEAHFRISSAPSFTRLHVLRQCDRECDRRAHRPEVYSAV